METVKFEPFIVSIGPFPASFVYTICNNYRILYRLTTNTAHGTKRFAMKNLYDLNVVQYKNFYCDRSVLNTRSAFI